MPDATRLTYANEEPTVDRLQIERFADGGVTVRLPGSQPTNWRREVISVAVAAAIMGTVMLFIFGRGGLALFWQRLSLLWTSPSAALTCATPLIIWLAIIPFRIYKGGKCSTVGVSPQRVYIDSWEGLFHRRILANRSALLKVTLAENPRGFVETAVGVNLHLHNRMSVIIGRRLKPKEIRQLTAVLKDAFDRTASTQEGTK